MAKTFSSIKAAGGLNVKEYVFKCPASATSTAVTGIAATDRLESAYGVKLSQAATGTCLVKTAADLTAYASLGTAKVILSNVWGMTNAAIHVIVHRHI
jgi:ribosomal protein S11